MTTSKKYMLIKDIMRDGVQLHRIEALRDIKGVRKGELGGLIEKETNLSHEGDCWVRYNAMVYGEAMVKDDAIIDNRAKVYGKAIVRGGAFVSGDAEVHGEAFITDKAHIMGNAVVFGRVGIGDNKIIENDHIASHKDYIFLDLNNLYYHCTKSSVYHNGSRRTWEEMIDWAEYGVIFSGLYNYFLTGSVHR